jgi:hypothetical protein
MSAMRTPASGSFLVISFSEVFSQGSLALLPGARDDGVAHANANAEYGIGLPGASANM